MKARTRVCVNHINRVKRRSGVCIDTHVLRAGETKCTGGHRVSHIRCCERPTDGWMDGRTNGRMNGWCTCSLRWIDVESEPSRCFYNISTVWNMHKTETRAHKITGKKVHTQPHTLSFTFCNQAATATAAALTTTIAAKVHRQQHKQRQRQRSRSDNNKNYYIVYL